MVRFHTDRFTLSLNSWICLTTKQALKQCRTLLTLVTHYPSGRTWTNISCSSGYASIIDGSRTHYPFRLTTFRCASWKMMIPSSFFFYPSFPINKTTCSLKHFLSQVPLILKTFLLFPWGPFLGSSETFRAYFGWHNSLCIFTTKASRGTRLCKVFLIFIPYTTCEQTSFTE